MICDGHDNYKYLKFENKEIFCYKDEIKADFHPIRRTVQLVGQPSRINNIIQ